jgi:hypothetical protein
MKVTLNMSNLPHLQGWAFQRLVSGCVLIEDLDCSNCDRLTDHDMTVMAQHCSKLRRLIVSRRRVHSLTDSQTIEKSLKRLIGRFDDTLCFGFH